MENKDEIIIYQTSDHQTQIEVKFEEGLFGYLKNNGQSF
jgi:hypothetical protein